MGKVGETLEEVEPHPMVLGIEARVVGYGGSTEEGGRQQRGLDGEGVPVVEGGREGAGKLRGVTVVLARGSEWAEELQRGGSTAVSSSPAFKVERRRVLGRLSGEKLKRRKEWVFGVFVVLVRVIEGGLGLCPGLATAAARWRARGRLWAAWRREGAPARVKKRWRRSSATRGCQRESRRGRLALHGAGAGTAQRRH